MIKYCLNKQHLEEFLKFKNSNGKIGLNDENLTEIIDGAYNWTCQVNLIVYFFSTYAQRQINRGAFENEEIQSFYETGDIGNFHFQQFDKQFIEYLFDHSRSRMNTMTLEDIIVKIQEDLADRNYASDFRY